jgi:hypothetical protein
VVEKDEAVLGLAKELKLVPSDGAASQLCLTRLIKPLPFTFRTD